MATQYEVYDQDYSEPGVGPSAVFDSLAEALAYAGHSVPSAGEVEVAAVSRPPSMPTMAGEVLHRWRVSHRGVTQLS